MKLDSDFIKRVAVRSGTSPQTCLNCLMCSGGCPFYSAMDMGPHGVLRRLQLGLVDQVLESSTIWLCVGCHTCSAACPMGIDIASVMDVLRRVVLEEGRVVAQPEILAFHREVLDSVKRYGRTHKLEIMIRYKAGQKSWFSDIEVGLRMLAKRKLDLRPSRIKDPSVLKGIFNMPGGSDHA